MLATIILVRKKYEFNANIDKVNSIVSMHAQQLNFVAFPKTKINSVEFFVTKQSSRLFFSEQIDGPNITERDKMPVYRQFYTFPPANGENHMNMFWYKINGLFSSEDRFTVLIDTDTNESDFLTYVSQPEITVNSNINYAVLFSIVIAVAEACFYSKFFIIEIILSVLSVIEPHCYPLFITALYVIRSTDLNIENLHLSMPIILTYIFWKIHPYFPFFIVFYSIIQKDFSILKLTNLFSITASLLLSNANYSYMIGIFLYLLTILAFNIDKLKKSEKFENSSKIVQLSLGLLILFVTGIIFITPSYLKYNKTQIEKVNDLILEFSPFASTRPMTMKLAKAAALALKGPYDYSECKLCKNPLPKEIHSSERDLIIMFATYESYKAVVPVRTIRTSGCRARILLITDETTALPFEFQDCGVTVVSTHVGKSASLNVRRGIRFPFMTDFLPLVEKDFDRILYIDGYDTIFQRDPFPEKIIYNQLHYSPENHTYATNYVLRQWRERAPNFNVPHWNDREVKCNGLILADTKTMWKIAYMETALFYRNGDNICEDQTFYEFLIEEDIISSHGIKLYRDRELASLLWSMTGYTKLSLGHIRQINTTWFPAIVHQALNVLDWREIIWQTCR